MSGKKGAVGAIVLGAALVVGEVAYVQYFAGDVIATARVYEENRGSATTILPIDESDMPLRVVFTAIGERDPKDRLGRPFADITVTMGTDGDAQTMRLTYAPEDEIPFGGTVSKTQSFRIGAPPLGNVPVLVSTGAYHQLKISKIDASFRGGGRGVSLAVLGVGALSFLLGVATMVRLRRVD